MINIEPACRPYSAKPLRMWERSEGKAFEEWIVRESKPTDWLSVQRTKPPLTVALPSIDEAIEKSRRILELPVNWDDEGAKPISEATWRRATEFLRRLASALRYCHSVSLLAPRISPCADGSIDLLWRATKLKLLINIQPEDSESDFYGETIDGLKVKGTFRRGIHELDFLKFFLGGLR